MHLLFELTHLMFLSEYNPNASQRLLSVLALQQAISYQVLFNSVARSTSHSRDLYVSHADEFLLNLLLKIHLLFKTLYGHLSLLRYLFPYIILRLSHSGVYTPRFLLKKLLHNHTSFKHLFQSKLSRHIHDLILLSSRLGQILLQ